MGRGGSSQSCHVRPGVLREPFAAAVIVCTEAELLGRERELDAPVGCYAEPVRGSLGRRECPATPAIRLVAYVANYFGTLWPGKRTRERTAPHG